MTQFAVISDLHSNIEALEAVLDAAEGRRLLFLGDLVGYGASPNAVVEILRGQGAIGVRGNHDQAALDGDVSWFNPKAAVALSWTRRELKAENMKFLESFPLHRSEVIEGTNFFMAHGSPEDNLREYVDPRTHQDLFPYFLKKTGASLIGLGHTHVPYVWKGDEGSVFNPGSVGQPRDGDPRASFATVDFGTSPPRVEIRKVDYDLDRAGERILGAGLPKEFADRLRLGL